MNGIHKFLKALSWSILLTFLSVQSPPDLFLFFNEKQRVLACVSVNEISDLMYALQLQAGHPGQPAIQEDVQSALADLGEQEEHSSRRQVLLERAIWNPNPPLRPQPTLSSGVLLGRGIDRWPYWFAINKLALNWLLLSPSKATWPELNCIYRRDPISLQLWGLKTKRLSLNSPWLLFDCWSPCWGTVPQCWSVFYKKK